jgi:hypothetical protein
MAGCSGRHPLSPAIQRSTIRRIAVLAGLNIKQDPHLKNNQHKRAGDVAQEVEPRKDEALSLTSSLSIINC